MQLFSAVLWCSLFVAIFIAIVLALQRVFDRWWIRFKQPVSNEFTGILFGALSLIYSLLIAFVIIAVWEDYEELNQTVEQEADKLNSIIAHTSTLPDSIKIPVHTALSQYCKNILNSWETPEGSDVLSASAIPGLRQLVQMIEPYGRIQEKLFDRLDNDLSDISDLRRQRLSHIRSHVPALVWFILLAGGILVILFSFFIYTESFKLKRIGISFLTAMVSMSFFLVYALDHPFTSSVRLSSIPYREVVTLLPDHK